VTADEHGLDGPDTRASSVRLLSTMARSVCRLSQISYALKAPDLCEGGPLRIQRKGAFGVFLALRPGAENILRFLPSQLRHQDVEYPRSTFSPSGCQRYDVHREPDARGVGTVISADSQMLLKRLKKYCMEHSIRVAYAMPWLYAMDHACLPIKRPLPGFFMK